MLHHLRAAPSTLFRLLKSHFPVWIIFSKRSGDNQMSTNVLITGATGLVGRNFAKRAVAAGFDVAAMVRAGSDRSVLDGMPVHFVEADLEVPDTLPGALSEAD